MGDLEDGPEPPTATLESGPAAPSSQSALRDLYRRRTVQCLRQADGPVPVADLARQVVARMGGKPPDTVSLDEQKRMYTALARTHLPALESAGFVKRDDTRDAVALSEEAAELLDQE